MISLYYKLWENTSVLQKVSSVLLCLLQGGSVLRGHLGFLGGQLNVDVFRWLLALWKVKQSWNAAVFSGSASGTGPSAFSCSLASQIL